MRTTARALLFALGVTTTGPLLHGVHDSEFQPIVVVHDESEHGLAAPQPHAVGAVEADHCIACHFVRTSRGQACWEASGLVSFTLSHLALHSNGRVAASPSAAPQPARAPPVFA